MVKADTVLLDVGNTLVLTPFDQILDRHGKYLFEPLAEMGYREKISPEEFVRIWKKADDSASWPDIAHAPQEEGIVQTALRDMGVKADEYTLVAPEILGRYRRMYRQALMEDTRSREVAIVLETLKARGKQLAILSNNRDFVPRAAAVYCGYAPHLEAIFSSEEIGHEKPDPRALSYVLERLGADPKKTVNVGDDPTRDVDGVKAYGMLAIQYNPPEKWRKDLFWRSYQAPKHTPDAVVNNLGELLTVIE